jgi:TatD DNase family protein
MIDAHCHVDLYPHPTHVAVAAERAGVLTVMVTNLPSAFDRAFSQVKPFKNIRLALGLHPLVAAQHLAERERFRELIDQTSYIGEIGLDFSPAGWATKDLQIESFKFVLRILRGRPTFFTIHSRRAESVVLDILEEEGRAPVVFHWYSGPLNPLDRAISKGHYFSINPAMIKSPNGRKIIQRLPLERVLTESDGPFVQVEGRSAIPSDVAQVEQYLGNLWGMETASIRARIRETFFDLIRPI